MTRILVTGGAGFIGGALVRALAEKGVYEITVMDNLSPQIHGPDAVFPEGLLDASVCLKGDLRDRGDLQTALRDQEIVVHLAAETGTGQSMYEIARYTSTNVDSTAKLLEECGRDSSNVRKIILASSRAIYGEGKYRCDGCGVVFPRGRTIEDMKAGDFEVHCPHCEKAVEPLPTDEAAPVHPGSIYGVTKAAQDQLVAVWGEALGVDTIALRFQNVYGPGQALNNPYTGILSAFSGLILDGGDLDIFENGLESRDFVFIDDAVDAVRMAIEKGRLPNRAYNVGTGERASISDVAQLLMQSFGRKVPAQISGHFRAGDIRHNFASTERCREDLGFQAQWDLEAGLSRLCEWVQSEGSAQCDLGKAAAELKSRGLLHSGKKLDS